MKNILLLLITFFHIITNCAAQKEWNTWYFGNNAGVDFNSGAPVVLNNGIINTSEGTASISDSSGSLLFYTDGIRVRNRDHVIMPNGLGLTGNSTSTHSAIILPLPGSPGIYYIFTTFDDFSYSIVDMSLDSGRGDITIKNQIILAGVHSEKQCITQHANGVDIWIVLNEISDFHAFLFSASGLSSVVVTSSVSSVSGFGPGQIKISPAGNRIAFGTYISPSISFEIELFDFDNNSGVVSGGVHLTNNMSQCYGLEFSPDGTKLYATGNGMTGSKLHQFNVMAGNTSAIQASMTELCSSTPFIPSLTSLQLASDHKIYVCRGSNHFLNVINDPNQPGTACNYQDSVLDLSPGTSQLGLPTLLSSQFYLTSVVEIDDNPLHVSVYPNPTPDLIYISNSKKEQHFDAILFDLNGRKILESLNNNSQVRIDLSKLPNAVYVLEIFTEKYRMQQKIIKF